MTAGSCSGLKCMVYIELNRVRAGVVKPPSQWPWCSYVEWMGLRERYRAVDRAECLPLAGGVTAGEFRANYETGMPSGRGERLGSARAIESPSSGPLEAKTTGSRKAVRPPRGAVRENNYLHLRALLRSDPQASANPSGGRADVTEPSTPLRTTTPNCWPL